MRDSTSSNPPTSDKSDESSSNESGKENVRPDVLVEHKEVTVHTKLNNANIKDNRAHDLSLSPGKAKRPKLSHSCNPTSDSDSDSDPPRGFQEFPRPLPPTFPLEPHEMWYNDNKDKDQLPPIYPSSINLSARNEPKLKTLPDLYTCMEIWESYLFPKDIRKVYEDKMKEGYEKFIADDSSRKFRKYIKYDEGELRIPFTHKPYCYFILFEYKSITEEQFMEHIDWVRKREAENVGKLSAEERSDYEKWKRIYKRNNMVTDIHYTNPDSYRAFLTEATIEEVSHNL